MKLSRKKYVMGFAASAAAAALMLASCSSEPGESNGSDSGGDSQELMQLSVSAGYAVPAVAQLYAAQGLGYFEEEGLEVTISESAGNLITALTSGQADIGASAATSPLGITVEGQPTTTFWSYAGAGSASLLGAMDVESPEQCTAIGSLVTGSGVYGSSNTYIEAFDMDAEIVPMADFPTIIAAMASGRVDCAVGVFTAYDERVQAGEMHYLVNTTDRDERLKYFNPAIPEGSFWGLTDVVDEKEEEIIAFLRAVDRANQWLVDAEPSEVAEVLRANPGFSNMPAELIEEQWPLQSHLNTVREENAGYIPADVWPDALVWYETFGFDNIQADDERLSYENMVDMSLLEAARGD